MRIHLLFCATLLAGCQPGAEPASESNQALFPLTTKTFENATIPVCFEDVSPQFAWQQGLIQSFLTGPDSWSAFSRVRFTGFQPCKPGVLYDAVHVCIGDRWPHVFGGTTGVGRDAFGGPCGSDQWPGSGVWLNPTYNLSPNEDGVSGLPCNTNASTLRNCLQGDTLHEFGHVLGFSHETNRPDAPGWCNARQGQDGNDVVGDFDANSIMSYCSSSITLSDGDKEGVQAIYGYVPSFEVSSNVHFPAGAPIAAVSRAPSGLDIFSVGNDGAIYSAWYNDWVGHWSPWFQVAAPGSAPPGTRLSVLARTRSHLDVFYTGSNGHIFNLWYDDSVGHWSAPGQVGNMTFAPGSPVSAIARWGWHIDLFVTAPSGRIATNWWDQYLDNANWHQWWTIPTDQYLPEKTELTVTSRTPDTIDLFAENGAGWIYHASFDGQHAWFGFANGSDYGRQAMPGSVIGAVARDATNVDLAVVLNDGGVYSSVYSSIGPPTPLQRIGTINVNHGTRLSMIARKKNHADLFVVGNDGLTYSGWLDVGVPGDPTRPALNSSHWYGLYPVGVHPVQACIYGCPPWPSITPVARFPELIDLFAVDYAGRAVTTNYGAIAPL